MAGSAILGWLSLALVATAGAQPAPAQSLGAALDKSSPASARQAAVPATEALPSVEMLMYFGEFEDSEGDFVDPLALESEAAKALGNEGSSADPKGKDAQ